MTTVAPITLPRLDATTVAAGQRLGRGLRYAFQVAGEPGELLLTPGRVPEGGVSLSFESRCGVFTLSDAGPLLSLFGECPVVLAETGNDPQSWFWGHFEQRMSAQLLALFGFLRPFADRQSDEFECCLSVVLGPSRSIGRLMMTAHSLLALCAAGQWQAVKATLPECLAVPVPVVLGSLALTVEQLRTLRAGDVLAPEHLLFNADGEGQLRVGRWRIKSQIDDEVGRRRLTLCALEELAVDEVMFTGTGTDVERHEGDEPFETLLVELSVRCGTLKLSLGELRQLAPGMVLSVEGYGAGMAGLYYGDRPIGHGQLVEVDGRLGLQLSRINFSQ